MENKKRVHNFIFLEILESLRFSRDILNYVLVLKR
jgi:hypothetical protein